MEIDLDHGVIYPKVTNINDRPSVSTERTAWLSLPVEPFSQNCSNNDANPNIACRRTGFLLFDLIGELDRGSLDCTRDFLPTNRLNWLRWQSNEEGPIGCRGYRSEARNAIENRSFANAIIYMAF